MVLEGSSMDTPDHQKDKPVGPRANSTWNIAGGKNDPRKLSYVRHIVRRQVLWKRQ